MYSYKTPAAPARQEDGYTELANAIVLQAVHDYRSVLKCLQRNPWDKKSLADKSDVERFFRSDWYTALTDVDSGMLISALKAEVGK